MTVTTRKRGRMPFTHLLLVLSWLLAGAAAFVPLQSSCRQSTHGLCTTTCLSAAAAVGPGDTVLVFGGTGGVGQLVTQKLLREGMTVQVASRNVERALATIGDERVQVVEVDLVHGGAQQLRQAMQGVNGLVISVGTTAFPTLKWWGGNTPQAIDQDAVTNIAKAAAKCDTLQRVCLVTSVGVDRTEEMPFKVLNLFGVLDAKKAGEQAIIQASKTASFDHAIVRPGRLIGGPFTNTDIAQLLQIEGGATNGVDVARGDAMLGDCKRDACAAAVVQCLTNPACVNLQFSLVSNDQPALTTDQWTAVFNTLR